MGTLTNQVTGRGAPLPLALLRLSGPEEALGGHPDAALAVADAITWTREIRDFDGSRWNCWQRYVAQDVAAITWQEFRQQVLVHNPSLADTGGRFQPGRLYFLPENRLARHVEALVSWERTLTGFAGSLWACWQRTVRGKVIGLTWRDFSEQFGRFNPAFSQGDGLLLAGETYTLPRTAGASQFYVAAYSDEAGQCRWDGLPAGVYRLTVSLEGYEPWMQEVAIAAEGELFLAVALDPVAATRARGFVEVKKDTAGTPRFFFAYADGERALPFVGVNLRGLLHYGGDEWLHHDQHILGASRREHIDQQLQHAEQMGARVIRVFAACKHVSPQEVGNRLQNVLDRCQARKMFVIAALTDLYNDTPFHPQGDDPSYTTLPDGHTLLNERWFTGDYRQNYLSLVDHLVTRFPEHPALFAWEIGNELKLDGQPHAFMKFNHDVARFIRQRDPNHLITTGMISTHHVHMMHDLDLQRQLYSAREIDFLTVHAYNRHWPGEQVKPDDPRRDHKIHLNDDSQLAAEVRKPFIVEEAGFNAGRGEKRDGMAAEDMALWFDRGAQGYMQWGFMATDFDNGDGDRASGMDRGLHHDDWEELFRVYRGKAGDLERQAAALPPAPVQPAPVAGFKPGQVVYTTKDVNLRSTPDASSKTNIIAQVPGRTSVAILGDSQAAGGYVWWRVRITTNGTSAEGWMAQAAGNSPLLSLV